jgi:WhiB family redox-sensing transcriptional regulator
MTDVFAVLVPPPVPPEDLSWQDKALCAQVDPDLFFPERGDSTLPAKRICARCEVRAECLDAALARGERWGIWGGLSEHQRRQLRRQAA